jgi:hypothetical protein
VSLVVIPPCPLSARVPVPIPSRALLDAVERHLEPRRLVTSEIRAIAPAYRRVAVQATLHIACGAAEAAVLKAAEEAVDAFLDPLQGGPDRSGWPFGRSIYLSEVMALLAAVEGVDRVTALSLRTADGACCGAGAPDSAGRCDNLALCAHELPLAGRHRLTVRSDLPVHFSRSDAHECESI